MCVALAAAAQKKKPAQRIELNTATAEQLATLPGIGPATARAIIQFREKSGPFERVEDLLAIRGISKRRFDALRPHVYVKAPPGKPAPPGGGPHRGKSSS